MPNPTTTGPLPRRYWILAVLAMLWNVLGLVVFLVEAGMTPELLATLPEAQRAIHLATPDWLRVVFGIAVVAGVAGALGLLLRRRWAAPAFLLSLLAVLVQLVAGYLVTPAWSLTGAAGLVQPVLQVVISLALYGHARRASVRGWLR